MHVCLISNQVAAWGKIGGFGTATRAIGKGLAERGVTVDVVVPRRGEQGRLEHLDGMTVHGTSALATLTSGRTFRDIGADIYHSQEPTIASWLARRAVPQAKHVITCRDPRGLRDHLVELRHTNLKRRLIAPATWYYEASPPVRRSVRRADAVFVPAPTTLTDRVHRLYGSDVDPVFVPSPIDLPDREPEKSPDPLAIFVGRWDHRKRIERFFDLARRVPEVRFVAVGRAHDERYDARLREEYESLPNVEMPGFLPRFGDNALYSLYERAWILVNTSAREGLPYTFLEATAWNCSILSTLDPEGFASRFGYLASIDDQDDLETGLRWLLEGDRWQELGRAAGEHVRATWSETASIETHLEHYRRLLAE